MRQDKLNTEGFSQAMIEAAQRVIETTRHAWDVRPMPDRIQRSSLAAIAQIWLSGELVQSLPQEYPVRIGASFR